MGDVDHAPEEVQSELVEMIANDALRMRVIATAVRSPVTLADAGQFSAELACLLSTITIELPPLAARLADLPLLAQVFLEEANVSSVGQIGGFSTEALDQLATYNWPGNIDELATVVREAHARARFGEVTVRDLPSHFQWAASDAVHPPKRGEPIALEEFLARVEKELITRALRRAKNNKSKAAKLLGLTCPRLYRRLVQLGLEQPDEPANP